MDSSKVEELRFALVTKGSLSLAVWMGGVTNEFFRLITQQHPVYQDVLAKPRPPTCVDVLSGSSSGEINGAALRMGLPHSGNFGALRNAWQQMGDFNDYLLQGDNLPFLLRGGEFSLQKIEDALATLAPTSTPVVLPERETIDLRLTQTFMDGYEGNFVDDLGMQPKVYMRIEEQT